MRTSKLAALLVSLLWIASCASPPEIDRVRAQRALSQAQTSQAEIYASASFQAGRSELERAETEMVIQLSRPRPFRQFSEAQRRFHRADETLRSAAQQSLSRQRELRQQTEDELREFDELGSNMEKQLAEMPDVFVDKKQIDKALGDLNLLRSEVPGVREKLESGDFQSAYHAARNLCVRETLLCRTYRSC
jgi:hypothetical protein